MALMEVGSSFDFKVVAISLRNDSSDTISCII